jgi:spermidine synthase
MTLDEGWFTEVCEESGTALSFAIEAKLHEEVTPYQTIAVYKTRSYGNLMVIDGFVMLTQRDNFIYHEMMSHPALFTHPRPKRVLVIGGGDCGTLREVLKHPGVEAARQVEIDERVTRLAEQYFPELCEANDDPRVELIFTDGITFLTEAAADSYDVIIIDSTDPVGQAARLFATPFYRDCKRVLGDEGMLIVQSESPLIHADLIASIRRNMAEAGFANRQTLHFPQSCYPSGWWSATMASDAPLDGYRPGLEQVGFETRYYNLEQHTGALAMPPFLAGSY